MIVLSSKEEGQRTVSSDIKYMEHYNKDWLLFEKETAVSTIFF